MASRRSEDTLVRTSITIPQTLLGKVSELVASGYFANRSEVVRQALREYLQRLEWTERLSESEDEYVGALVYVFDHEKAGVELVDVQHEYRDVIIATTHMHITERLCLEVLLLRGKGSKISELSKRIRGMKGVKQAKLTVARVEE